MNYERWSFKNTTKIGPQHYFVTIPVDDHIISEHIMHERHKYQEILVKKDIRNAGIGKSDSSDVNDYLTVVDSTSRDVRQKC